MAFIYYVTQIQFDFGAVRLLKQECERIGITRPLVVTDPGVKAAGVLQQALDALPGRSCPRSCASTRRPNRCKRKGAWRPTRASRRRGTTNS
jgi:alcohol dehydrogenase class IV